MENGLLPPIETKRYSNFHNAQPGDENYIYLITHYDPFFAQEAVKKYGGEEILIIVTAKKENLELDNFHNVYTNPELRNIQNLKDQNELYKTLAGNDGYAQCRSLVGIEPNQILEVFKLNELYTHPCLRNNYEPLAYTSLQDYFKRYEILSPPIKPMYKRN